jgi:hypothetical protein
MKAVPVSRDGFFIVMPLMVTSRIIRLSGSTLSRSFSVPLPFLVAINTPDIKLILLIKKREFK